MNGQAGKGDAPRHVNGELYRAGIDRIFGKKPILTEKAWDLIERQDRKKAASEAVKHNQGEVVRRYFAPGYQDSFGLIQEQIDGINHNDHD